MLLLIISLVYYVDDMSIICDVFTQVFSSEITYKYIPPNRSINYIHLLFEYVKNGTSDDFVLNNFEYELL